MATTKKVTISLPKDLLAFADRLASERSTSRSAVIARLLEHEEQERIKALMIEGYKAMAEENLKFAEKSIPLILEILPPWDENDDQKS